MALASRNFNKKQALEKEIKDLYLRMIVGDKVAATATLDLTEDIVLTSVATGEARNGTTFTLEVAAAAANPTDTVLAAFTGDANDIVLTITPNDGTNNSATPVNLTTEEVVELINTGAVAGKNVTLTDSSDLRGLQTATGGDDTNVANGGEGDSVEGTFSGGTANNPTIVSGYGIESVERSDEGEYKITLQDAYNSLKFFKAKVIGSTAVDLRCQLKSEDVQSKTLSFFLLSSATPTDPADDTELLIKLELKNTDVV